MPAGSGDALGRLLGDCFDQRDLPVPLPSVLRRTAAATTAVAGLLAVLLIASGTPAVAPRGQAWDWSWAGPGAELVRGLCLYGGQSLVVGGLLGGCAVAGAVTASLTQGWREGPAWQHFSVLVQAAVTSVLMLPVVVALLVLLVQLVVLIVLGVLLCAGLLALLLGALSG